ncbi:MAG: hypothetical protein QUU85_11650 [Candidatus Eisenbacteria bacterium]|nr:hypothetical protein [Candidatus Eisenbacteria bacterium]
MSDKSTNSPHLVATGGGLAIAFWIGLSIVGIWVAVLYMGGQVNP